MTTPTNNWEQLTNSIGNFLAPSMAKDHPNLPVTKAEGCYYYGTDGKQYLDFTSGIAVENVGHRHPKVVQAIKDSTDHLVHGPSGVIIYESILKLAEELQEIMPGNLDNFFFSNSGTEAIEGGLKLAKHVTKRPYIISFTGNFHGRSIGSLSVSTSKSKYRKFQQPSWLTYQLPYALPEDCPSDEDPDTFFAAKLEKDVTSLFKHQVDPEEVACMILEPVMGEGGYIIPPKSWLKKVREICDRHGILLIFDEVQTGFGRTGNWFAAQSFGVTPDIMAIAKGIAAGLPLSATVASKELMEQWPLGSHGTTFGGNPIACAAARASLSVIKEENLLENASEMGSYALTRLTEMKQRYDVIHEVRGIGLMLGIELRDPVNGKPDGEAVMNVLNSCLEAGVLFYLCGNEGEVIRMIPPLTITKEQIDQGLNVLDNVLARL
ncbi:MULTISPECIES: aspartate aminotransferase family protein [Virgibacillus]|uniref:4-aminobutyrate aminotransferase PuuE n=2 Tax=Virgibacillus TaxID=84406 RepID=A0A024QDD1_9BACI|nr:MULTISPECIES: aspartate aminotransferase family protein [Virgibacillus]EQB36772.1 4-aminobutyrate aminotransferase [Virgibacillus sp. CM-4]MYL42597.1 aminotransferase class III-fold pyridoxal phosphate-dependent enzyme [Virgibacillus massiliensis]GGJ73795.1 aspartate aminotransferase family protein [Virgibacillus kapii]CDQ40479.1 4-aminobutyrate aminotransferase PuuE [Virgibacillus massiliensis]